ncbi:MAG: outer membrane beta-barrel protein, partial [Bacteroidota bacterium]
IKTTYQNIGQEDAYGLSLFANINIGNKFSLNGGADTYYAMLDNNNPDPQYTASNEGWVASGRLFGNYNLSKGWGFQFFSFYRGRQVQLQGSQGGFGIYSLGLRKEFNNKKGSVGFAAENFFTPSFKIKSEVISANAQRYSTNTIHNMSFRINFSYRIGKMNFNNQPRRRKSVSNDDLKEGGGDNNQGDTGQQSQRGNTQMPLGGQRPVQNQKQNVANTATKPIDATLYEAAGTWTYTIDAPQGGGGTIVLKKENGVYSGTIKSDRMKEETAVQSLVVNGNDVSFSYPVNFGGNAATVDVKVTISNDNMQGTLSVGSFRTFNLNGKRSN